MKEPSKDEATDTKERRRFLHESVKGSVHMVWDWIAGKTEEAEPAAVETPRSSPPPEAKEDLPERVKEVLERHYRQHIRDKDPSEDSDT